MVKKYLLATVLLCFSLPANAQEFEFKPYVGIDLQRTSISYNDNYDLGGGLALDGETLIEDGLNGLNIHVGNRFHENFGLELGYFRTKEEDKTVLAGTTIGPGTVAVADMTSSIQVQGVTFDALGYLPVAERVELIGT